MPTVRRRTESSGEYSANFLELFFDLVYVFAITQVAHSLLGHLDWEGAAQSGLLLLVVWWAWNYTTWVTNELDPDENPVRLLLLALMLASLLMAIAIPDAFGDKALLFAGSYVALQVGRHVFLAFYAAGVGTLERERARRILIWFIVAGSFWIAGALADGEARTALWLVALVIDYSGPITLYWLPGVANVGGDTWEVGSHHFAERFGLFVIIALGESIIITGATTAELELDTKTIAAFSAAFIGTATLWWLYFTNVRRDFERALSETSGQARTLVARDVFTYGHVLIIAAIILVAVGDELVIAHPTETLADAELLAVVAGPTAYLLAQLVLRLRLTGQLSVSRALGAAACVLVGYLDSDLPALAVLGLLIAVLVAVAVSDHLTSSGRGRTAVAEAGPGQAS